MEENQQHLYAIEQLCGTQFLIFLTSGRIEFIFLRERFSKFWGLNMRCIKNHEGILQFQFFFLKLYSSVVCVKVSVTASRDWPYFIWNILYSKTLSVHQDVSMMYRDWSIFFQEFFTRWQFVILNTSQTSFILILFFVIFLTAVKHRNQWLTIRLFVKKELIRICSS